MFRRRSTNLTLDKIQALADEYNLIKERQKSLDAWSGPFARVWNIPACKGRGRGLHKPEGESF